MPLAQFVAVHSRISCRQHALCKIQEAITSHIVERIPGMRGLQLFIFIFCHMDTTMVSSRQQNLSLFLSLGVLFAYITIFVDEFRTKSSRTLVTEKGNRSNGCVKSAKMDVAAYPRACSRPEYSKLGPWNLAERGCGARSGSGLTPSAHHYT